MSSQTAPRTAIIQYGNSEFRIISLCESIDISGEEFTRRLFTYVKEPYRQKEGGNVRAVQKLRREVEGAKRYMSQENADQLTLFILSVQGNSETCPERA